MIFIIINTVIVVRTHAVGLAGLAVDEVLEAPCEPSVLFPRSGGNIHSFTALTPSAILDVLSPPYNDDLGRPSTYFYELPIRALPGSYYTSVPLRPPRQSLKL